MPTETQFLIRRRKVAVLLSLLIPALAQGENRSPDHSQVPGIVIHHSPAASGRFVGSPSIVILPDGSYVASHDFFGPNANHRGHATTLLFSSHDQGRTWQEIAVIRPLFWGKLFRHRERLYILGTRHEYGDILIRRSDDGGRTWTEPESPSTGILGKGRYHCAPGPIAIHNGRLWRSFELAEGRRPEWTALVISAPVDGDLLNADKWAFSAPLHHGWTEGAWPRGSWIEGNVVTTPQGKLVNILRANGTGKDRAAIAHVADDGKTLSHDPEQDIIDFPGGEVKFTIRFDPRTSRYWSIVNQQTDPSAQRNHLVLSASEDLRHWTVASPLLFHPSRHTHAWQYVDWQFEGEDIVFVSRTAFDDGLGGARRGHDANYLTFHRIPDFRNRAPGRLTEDRDRRERAHSGKWVAD